MAQHNLFAALRAAFPANLDQVAVEATAPGGQTLFYTWRDLDHASARIAQGHAGGEVERQVGGREHAVMADGFFCDVVLIDLVVVS